MHVKEGLLTVVGTRRVAVAVAGNAAVSLDGLGQGRLMDDAGEVTLGDAQPEKADIILGGVESGGEDVGHGKLLVNERSGGQGVQAIVAVAAVAQVGKAEAPGADGLPGGRVCGGEDIPP